MNVFVLTTGRSGSTTFYEACKHIENYTCGHESRAQMTGEERLNYPDNHIEIDNRLSWFLGRLDEKYGDDAIYIHLKRDERAVAASYFKRRFFQLGIMGAYSHGILMKYTCDEKDADDLIKTVNTNINYFLKDKSKKMVLDLENVSEDFIAFVQLINGKTQINNSVNVFNNNFNSKPKFKLRQRLSYFNIALKQFINSAIFIFRYK